MTITDISTIVDAGHHQPTHDHDHHPCQNAPTPPLDQLGRTNDSSLSLFRSYSMPIPSSGSTDPIINRPPTLGRVEDENEEEDELDDEDLLATPTTSDDRASDLIHPSYQSSAHRLLSTSLPPSLNRRKTSLCPGERNDRHHENPLNELLQLTQPMREGVMAREKLLPSSRMKQVGIGGRGRRSYSNQHKPILVSSSPQVNHHYPMNCSGNDNDLLSPTMNLDQSLSPISSSNNVLPNSSFNFSGQSPSIIHRQSNHQTPLLRPRPILAWQRSQT